MIFSVPVPGNNTILTVGSDYSSGMDDYITVSINKKAVLSFYNYENKMYEIEVEVGDKIDAAGGGGWIYRDKRISRFNRCNSEWRLY